MLQLFSELVSICFAVDLSQKVIYNAQPGTVRHKALLGYGFAAHKTLLGYRHSRCSTQYITVQGRKFDFTGAQQIYTGERAHYKGSNDAPLLYAARPCFMLATHTTQPLTHHLRVHLS